MSNVKLFESAHIRSVWNETDGKWYFSVADVVQALTDSANVRDYIKKMRKRETELDANWGTLCPPLERLAPADNLRDHMTDLELIFTMLGEASTTEIARNRDAQGYDRNREAAIEGGAVAGTARIDLEKKSGRRVATRENYKALPEAVVRKKLKSREG